MTITEGLEVRRLAGFHESPDNPRKISAERFAALKYALANDPAMLEARPIIATPDGEVVCGNMRLRALTELGVAEAPVYVRDLSPTERREWMLRDNQEYGDWVPEELAALVALHAAEEGDMQLLGLTEKATDDLIDLAQSLDEEEAQEEAEEPPAPDAIVKLGEVWALGRHRLACGSSVDRAAVEQLLASADPDPVLIATDPPFGVELEMEWRDDAGFNSERFAGAKDDDKPEAIRGRKPTAAAEESYLREGGRSTDTRADWSEAYALCPSAIVIYCWHADRYVVPVIQGLESIGFRYVQSVVWDKQVLVLSRTLYHFRHELCAVAAKKDLGYPIPFHGEQDQDTIWAALSPKRLGAGGEEKLDHPTQKPQELFERPIRNHLRRGEAVYDPFVGSGTAIMAAEDAGRIAFGMELHPPYCDLAIDRFERATGQKARKLHAAA